jgi:hypothetical protein
MYSVLLCCTALLGCSITAIAIAAAITETLSNADNNRFTSKAIVIHLLHCNNITFFQLIHLLRYSERFADTEVGVVALLLCCSL